MLEVVGFGGLGGFFQPRKFREGFGSPGNGWTLVLKGFSSLRNTLRALAVLGMVGMVILEGFSMVLEAFGSPGNGWDSWS